MYLTSINYKYRLIALAIGLSLIHVKVGAQLLEGDRWEQIKQQGSGEITFTYFEMDGFSYTNKEGVRTGVAIDIFKHFVNFIENTYKVNLSVNYRAEKDFVTFFNSVKNGSGGVFGMGNVTITEPRKEQVAFSPPYFRNIAVLITHSSAANLTNMEQLSTTYADKIALVYSGTTHEQRFERLKNRYFPEMKTKAVHSNDQAVEMVSSDPKYYSYVDLPIYWSAHKRGVSIKRQPVGDESSESFGMIMPLDSDWKEPVREFFNIGGGYRSNAAYRDILITHLGVEVTKMLQLTRDK